MSYENTSPSEENSLVVEPLAGLIAAESELYRRDLGEFIQGGWHVLEPGPLVWGWHLDAMCEHLEAQTRAEIRNLIINVPPRSSKTSVTSIMWPAWEWTLDPSQRFACSSYSDSLSLDIALQMRRLVTSDWYRLHFPNVVLAADQQSKSKFDTTAKGYRISTSTGGTITGKGAGRLLADDPHNTKNSESEVQRANVISWWRRTFSNRANDAKKVTKTIVMQRVHEGDLSGVLLGDGGWEHLCLPTEFEAKRRCVTVLGTIDNREVEGELLQPERFGPAEVAQAKIDFGSYGYAGQHQQRPSPAEGGMFKKAWWRFWRHPHERDVPGLEDRTVVLPPRFDEWLLSLDCTFKKTSDSDFVALGAWAKDGANKYLMQLFWERATFTETQQALKTMAADHPQAMAKLVESAANGEAIIDSLHSRVPGLIGVPARGSKEARASATSPQIESGNVYLPLHASWRERFMDEHAAFPKGVNDDVVDMTSQALGRWIKSPLEYKGQTPGLMPRRV